MDRIHPYIFQLPPLPSFYPNSNPRKGVVAQITSETKFSLSHSGSPNQNGPPDLGLLVNLTIVFPIPAKPKFDPYRRGIEIVSSTVWPQAPYRMRPIQMAIVDCMGLALNRWYERVWLSETKVEF